MSYKQRFYVHLGVILAVLGGLCYLGYFTFTLITTAGDSIGQSQQDLAVLAAKKGQITDLVREYDVIKDSIPQLNDALLQKDNALGFIMHVEDISVQTNVMHKIDTVDVAQGTDKNATPSLSFNLDLVGTFNDVLRFVYLIESGKPYASLQGLQLSEGGNLAGFGQTQQPTNAGQLVTAHAAIKVYAR